MMDKFADTPDLFIRQCCGARAEAGAARSRNFGQSQSWSRYTEVSALAPGQTKVVNVIIIHIE
jgi:hypothetical protein